MKESPLLSRVVAVRVAVRLDHRGGLVLGDAVDHDLHGAEREPVLFAECADLIAARGHGGELFDAAGPIPPLGSDDVRAQAPVGERAAVCAERVPDPAEAADHGVLPAGDAETQQLVLRAKESGVGEVVVDGGPHVVEEVAGALVEGARREAVGLALDAAVGGVGGRRVEAGGTDGGGVDPGAVVIAAEEKHRAVGHDRVEEVASGAPPGKWSIDHPPPRIHASSGVPPA